MHAPTAYGCGLRQGQTLTRFGVSAIRPTYRQPAALRQATYIIPSAIHRDYFREKGEWVTGRVKTYTLAMLSMAVGGHRPSPSRPSNAAGSPSSGWRRQIATASFGLPPSAGRGFCRRGLDG